MNYVKQRYSLILDELAIKNPRKTTFFTKYDKARVTKMLNNPSINEKELRKVVDSLICLSPQFQNLVDAIPNMCLFRPVVIPILKENNKNSIKEIKKVYEKASEYIEKMNIQDEFQKGTKKVFKYDVFYGYEIENNREYFIKDLNPDYCRISSFDSCLNFAFDFNYFKNKEEILKTAYPNEFMEKYKKYKSSNFKQDLRWQELDTNKTVCIKYFNGNKEYAFPPYASLFNDIYDLQDYKDLNKAKVKSDIIKLLLFKIPMKQKGEKADDFLLSLPMIKTYMGLLDAQLPKEIAAVTTPMEAEEIKFSQSAVSQEDEVAKAEKNLFSSSSMAPAMFGIEATTGSTLEYSTKNDNGKVLSIYRQWETWLNRKFSRKFNGKIRIKLLDITVFNEKEVKAEYLKASQMSVPCKTLYASALGLQPSEMMGLTFLENKVLNIHEEWLPLNSTHTQTGGDKEKGRPKKDNDDISESGEKCKDKDVNNNK